MKLTGFVGVLLLVSVGCGPSEEAIMKSPSPAPAPRVTVERVIDGDTFVLNDRSRVRVLGIDSCERGTRGYDIAKRDAEMLLLGKTVRLTAPDGVDTDRYKRLLRYVELESGDYGKQMIKKPHTTVYDGRNDADPQYIRDLERLDDGPMVCGEV